MIDNAAMCCLIFLKFGRLINGLGRNRDKILAKHLVNKKLSYRRDITRRRSLRRSRSLKVTEFGTILVCDFLFVVNIN